MAGSSFSAERTRSSTIWRASQMSVPSLKIAVTAESPERDTDRSSIRFGMPFSAISIGNVTDRSTSTGDSPGASVSAATWIVETSGTASIGSARTAKTPPASRATNRAMTSPFRRMETTTRLSSMSAEDLRLQREDARGDHFLPGLDAGEDLDALGVLPAEQYGARFDGERIVAHEHGGLAVDADDCATRQKEGGRRRGRGANLGEDRLSGPQKAFGVGYDDAHGRGTRVEVDHVADVRDDAGDFSIALALRQDVDGVVLS